MKSFSIYLVIMGLILVISSPLFAQGEAAGEFLLIAPGARAGGMGEANVAIADDAAATYWNPAGLANLTGNQFTVMRSEWLPQFNLGDMFYWFGAYTREFEDLGTFGVGVTYLTLGEQVRTDENGNELGRFDSFNTAFNFSYGMRLSDNMTVGATAKYIYLKLSDRGTGAEKGSGNASSVAVDLGMLYDFKFLKPMTFGVNLANMGPSVSFVDVNQSDPIPTNIRFGLASRLLDGRYHRLTWTTEFTKLLVVRHVDEEGSHDPWYKALVTAWTNEHQGTLKRISVATGVEYWYNNLVALRTGYFYEDIGKRRFWTFGGGLRYSIYGIDVGYIYADKEGSPLADTIRISFGLMF